MTYTNELITDELVTSEEIKRITRGLRPCRKGLRKLKAGMTYGEAAGYFGAWLLEYAGDRLTPAQFDICIEAQPLVALVYATRRMTPAQRNACHMAVRTRMLECVEFRYGP